MKCICLFAAIMFLCRPRSVAQDVNYAIHANIIYHFTKYIDWPPSRKSGDFIIGIVGTTPLTDELKTSLANKKVGVQNIIVKKYPASTASFDCHILFISEDETRSFKKILAATKGLSILVVSEAEDLALRGSCINFTIANERLKLEINKVNIEQRELSIASELLKLGTIVKN
ncbi:MAG TPA: YfiR family protein [Chitinophagaceae bacterium]|nr:YfiR family protein [Chitinophagaceae bacterium]